jgi:hypothetical protein
LSNAKTFYELKIAAKWSDNAEEKKIAIRELSSRGEEAIPSLEEILSVTAYEDIKAACIAAIKAIKENGAADTTDVKKKEGPETAAKEKPKAS